MTSLEDRLRTDLRTESELIEPRSIPPLRLPAVAPDPPGALRRTGLRRWPGWVTGLAAAAAVIAVIAGALGHRA